MNAVKIGTLIICMICLSASPVLLHAENQATEEERYQKIEDSLDVLYDLEKYDEAIELIHEVCGELPEYDYELSNSLTIFYRATKQYEKCIEVWEKGHKKGYFYGILPSRRYDPFKGYKRFADIMKEDTRLRELATENSKSIVEVFTPREMMPDKQYPLLIVLHGGGSSNERAKEQWKSDMLDKDYIVGFIQSYFCMSLNTYGWRLSDPRTHEDIRTIYKDLIAKYPVDLSHVVIGGISAGGSAAIDISMNEIIPTAGFIGVCPGMPEEFDSEKAEALQKKGFRAYIIGGEKDFYLERQNQMAEIFKEANLPYKQEVIEGMGHQYPDNFSSWIDSALQFIFDAGNAG